MHVVVSVSSTITSRTRVTDRRRVRGIVSENVTMCSYNIKRVLHQSAFFGSSVNTIRHIITHSGDYRARARRIALWHKRFRMSHI